MLDLIPSFIDTVVGELTPAETVDFLPFVALLTNRFRVRTLCHCFLAFCSFPLCLKDAFEPMLDSILGQIFAKVYSTLQAPIQGTDDEVRQSELKRAYFNLILSIITSGYARIFVSPRKEGCVLFASLLLTNCFRQSTTIGDALYERSSLHIKRFKGHGSKIRSCCFD